mmetsp:Transcript_98500/g.256661  ORF Transcript_98500/g.256661 Transcript_98500/m.256661 type:complete len:419 (+) Transcript_98500:115-1371(+)
MRDTCAFVVFACLGVIASPTTMASTQNPMPTFRVRKGPPNSLMRKSIPISADGHVQVQAVEVPSFLQGWGSLGTSSKLGTLISTQAGLGAATSVLTSSATKKTFADSLTVFYHIFQSDASGGEVLSASIVREQLSVATSSTGFGAVQRFNFIFVGPDHSAVPALLNCSTCQQLEHRAAGDEVITLQHVHDHCVQNPTGRVLYMHSKGSFHNTPENVVFRRFITKGAWSDACQTMPQSCSACASRFSPLPHQHYPGNIWVARCEYVSRLIPPVKMVAAMEQVATTAGAAQWNDMLNRPDMVGRGRFSMEHWLSSHPSFAPCEVYDRTDYLWGESTTQIPQNWKSSGGSTDWTPEVRTFPRSETKLSGFCQAGLDLDLDKVKAWRIFEWQHLYPTVALQSSPLPAYFNASAGGNCKQLGR